MQNRVTLAQCGGMTVEQVANLPVDQLAMLLEDVAEQKASTKALEDRLLNALALRYAGPASEKRKAEGKDTGRVSLPDGEFVVRADLPKKVDWNQAELRQAMETVRSWGEDPAHYINMRLDVAETKFKAWPPSIQKVFEPARTVGVGKPSFTIERAKQEAA